VVVAKKYEEILVSCTGNSPRNQIARAISGILPAARLMCFGARHSLDVPGFIPIEIL
jgi:hypothetical protein